MKKLIYTLLVCLLFANFAEARIGETLPELEKRFGKGKIRSGLYTKPPFTVIYTFTKNDVSITAYFISGDKCDMISYSAKAGQYFKPGEIPKLLEINQQGFKWEKTDKPTSFDGKDTVFKPKESWTRTCGKMFAYNYANRTLCILSQNYLDKQKEVDNNNAADKAKKEETKLDGF